MSPARLILCAALSWWCFPSSIAGADKSGVKPQSISIPTGPGSVEGLGESFEPQLNTGSAPYSFKFALPTGRAGLAPELSLSYNSGGGNSPFGLGWGVSVPHIQRQTDKGQPNYGSGPAEDTFVFLGEELIRLTDGSYRVENESGFQRFRRVNDGWEVQEKSGRALRFGQYPNAAEPGRFSRQQVPETSDSFDSTFCWSLDSIEDVNGNLIELFYDGFDDSPGNLYLVEVRYTLRSESDATVRFLAPHHRVNFLYEARADQISDFRSGFEIVTGRRCFEVRVLTVSDPSRDSTGKLVRRYQIGYVHEVSPGAQAHIPSTVSRLQQITQRDAIGNEIPPLRFGYYDLGLGPEASVGVKPVEALDIPAPTWEFLDVNLDALPDLLLTNGEIHRFLPNLGSGRFGQPEDFGNLPGIPGINLNQEGVTLLDIDGDGSSELVHRRGGGSRDDGVVYHALERITDQARASGVRVRWGEGRMYENGLGYSLENPYVRLLDVDCDKTIDIVRADETGMRIVRNVSASNGLRRWVEEKELRYGSQALADLSRGFNDPGANPPRPDPFLLLSDMNGDRLLDLVSLYIEGSFVEIQYWPNRGSGSWAASRDVAITINSKDYKALFLGAAPGSRLRIMDVNADGLGDLVFPDSGLVRLWINLGGDHVSNVVEISVPEFTQGATIREADLNGNGTTDLVWWNPSAEDPKDRFFYLDFVPGPRPNLLKSIDNGLGKITTIEYRSSVDYYVSARDAGDPWETPLQISVPVVSRMVTTPSLDLDSHSEIDGNSRDDQYITELYYKDGYYDGFEKEFRGFAQASRVERGDDRHGDLIAAGAVHTPTTVTRYRFHTGAPNGVDDDGDGSVDEVNDVAGREEEPLKGRPIWTEVTALESGTPGYVEYHSDGDRRPEWLLLVRTGSDDGADNDADGQVDEPDEKQFANDALVFSREIKSWDLKVIHSSTHSPALVPANTVIPEREVRFAFEEQTDKLIVEGPNRRLLGTAASEAPVRATRSAHEFDDFGNVSVEFNHGVYPDTPDSHDERLSRTEYAHGGLAISRWILDRVAVSQVADESGKIISEKRMRYGDSEAGFEAVPLGQVSRQALLKEELSLLIADTTVGKTGADSKLIKDKRLAYDIYGNTVILLDPLGDPAQPQAGHARELAYDPTFHTFPITETIHVGKDVKGTGVPPLFMRASYDLAFGTLTAATDFNLAPVSQFFDKAVGAVLPGTARSVTGNVTRFIYDSFGRLVKIVKPGDTEDFPTSLFTYIHADPSRDRIYVYDSFGTLVGGTFQTVNAHIAVGGLELDLSSEASAVVSIAREEAGAPSGLVSIQYTDGAGHKLAQVSESENPGTFVVKESTAYDSRGQPFQVAQPYFGSAAWGPPVPGTPFTESFRDAANRTIRSVLPPDVAGVRDFTSTIYLPLEERQFDEDDNRDGSGGLPRSPFAGTYKSLFNDGLGRLVRVHETSRLDDEGRPVADLRVWPTRYTYDLLDNLIEVLDSQSNRKTLRYDSLKRKTRLDDPDRGILKFTYDDASNVLETIDAKSQHILQTYDGVNRLLTEDYLDEGEVFSQNHAYEKTKPLSASNRPDVAYFYDAPVASLEQGDGSVDTPANTRGMLAHAWDLSGEEHTSFDARGRVAWSVKRVRDPLHGGLVGYRTGFAYDSLDRVTGITYPDNDAVGYEYNDRNLPLRITGGQAGGLSPDNTIISRITYQPSGQQTEIRYGNGVRTSYAYDPRLRLKELLTVSPPALQSKELIHFAYDFDGVSNIDAIRDLRPAASVPEGDPRRNTQIFQYDDLYRLTRVQYSFHLPGNAVRNDGVINYRYDRIGNMLEQSSTLDHKEKGMPVANLGLMESGGGPTGRMNRVGRAAGDPPGPHALGRITNPSAPVRNYRYDSNGNMTLIDGLATTYDFKDRLVLAESEEMRAEYVYDHTDRRIVKRVEWKNPTRADGTKPVAPVTHVVYVDKHFEVRDNDVPTKYVWNGETRVARVTGTLSPNVRVQRIRVHAGWNLVSVAVFAPKAFVDQSAVVEEVYRWRPGTLDWVAVSLTDAIPAGTVLWVRARRDATLRASGVYPGPPQTLRATPEGAFLPGRGLEALPLDTQPTTISAWYFDGGAPSWRVRLAPPLDLMRGFPTRLAPGEAVFAAASEAQVELDMVKRVMSIAYYHQDHLGSTGCVTKVEGGATEEMAFYAFGGARNVRPTSEGDMAFAFTSQERETESHLDYFGARYYNNIIGRWVSPDPLDWVCWKYNTNAPKLTRDSNIAYAKNGFYGASEEFLQRLCHPQGSNSCAYVRNNPIHTIDLLGLVEGSESNLNKRAEIAQQSVAADQSTKWAYSKKTDDFPANSWKCNEFVNDIVRSAGAEAKFLNRGPVAGEWKNPNNSIANWRPLKPNESPQPGDVAAIKIRNPHVGATGHAGIVISDGKSGVTVISAHKDEVSKSGAQSFSKQNSVTYRRYTGE